MLIVNTKKVNVKKCMVVEGDPVLSLLDYWQIAFKKRFKIDYQYQTQSKRYDCMTDIFIAVKRDIIMVKKIIDFFLNSPETNWINNKTLAWLTPSNLAFIIPNLNRKNQSKKRPNWTSSRGVTYSVTAI